MSLHQSCPLESVPADPVKQPAKQSALKRPVTPLKPRQRAVAPPQDHSDWSAFASVIDLGADISALPLESLETRRKKLQMELQRVDNQIKKASAASPADFRAADVSACSDTPPLSRSSSTQKPTSKGSLAAELRKEASLLLDMAQRSPPKRAALNVAKSRSLPLKPDPCESRHVSPDLVFSPLRNSPRPRGTTEINAPPANVESDYMYTSKHRLVLEELEALRHEREQLLRKSTSC